MLLEAEGKMEYIASYVKANQNFAKNKCKTKQLPITWCINCG